MSNRNAPDFDPAALARGILDGTASAGALGAYFAPRVAATPVTVAPSTEAPVVEETEEQRAYRKQLKKLKKRERAAKEIKSQIKSLELQLKVKGAR